MHYFALIKIEFTMLFYCPVTQYYEILLLAITGCAVWSVYTARI